MARERREERFRLLRDFFSVPFFFTSRGADSGASTINLPGDFSPPSAVPPFCLIPSPFFSFIFILFFFSGSSHLLLLLPPYTFLWLVCSRASYELQRNPTAEAAGLGPSGSRKHGARVTAGDLSRSAEAVRASSAAWASPFKLRLFSWIL